jgi:hypothetical protein
MSPTTTPLTDHPAMDTYLIYSVEHSAWWGPDRCGYVRSIAKAGRYSQAEALRLCIEAMPGTSTRLGALPELPVRLADIETMVAAYDTELGDRPEPWR